VSSSIPTQKYKFCCTTLQTYTHRTPPPPPHLHSDTWPDTCTHIAPHCTPRRDATRHRTTRHCTTQHSTTHFNSKLNTTHVTPLRSYHKCNKTQSYVVRSTDAGETWTSPADGNLTNLFSGHTWQMLQFGEGMGLVLPDRIFTCGWIGSTLAANQGSFGHAGVQCIKSMDNGKTWFLAGRLPSFPNVLEPEEPEIAVLKNGSVLLNMRDALKSHRRWEALSNDRGDTFSDPWETGVIGPTSNAALITLASGQVVFANPRSTTSRVNLSLYTLNQDHVGKAEGEWEFVRTITEGGSAYVTSTRVANPASVGLLFETGSTSNPYESINYLVVNCTQQKM
jgi:hypothetical protein